MARESEWRQSKKDRYLVFLKLSRGHLTKLIHT